MKEDSNESKLKDCIRISVSDLSSAADSWARDLIQNIKDSTQLKYELEKGPVPLKQLSIHSKTQVVTIGIEKFYAISKYLSSHKTVLVSFLEKYGK